MRIRYTDRAVTFLRKLEERDREAYHTLQGTIILLATDPAIDNETKVLIDFGGDNLASVYVAAGWWIVYRVDWVSSSEQSISIMSIWEADSPPHISL